MKANPVIFREYDIRGVYKKDYDEEFARDLARSFVTYLKKKTGVSNPTITLGGDARLSTPSLVNALAEGFKMSGAKVIRLGLITTPISYFSTFHLKVDGAVMVTGSHNPPEYNGYKISAGKTTIFGAEIQEIRKIYEAQDFQSGHGSEETYDIFPPYVEKYKKEFSHLKNVPVVLDCGNGAAGCIVRKLYEACGLKPFILFEEPDGRFPNHHPDPTIEENLVALSKKVRDTKSLVGIGFDGDADRIGVVDENGRMLYGDELMVVVSRHVLSKQKGQKIIGDVKCSDRLYQDIEKNGGQPIMWKTGHSLIKEKIKIEKAPFGGEMSGHIFFADRNYGYDDALYAGLRVIEILSETGKAMSKQLDGLPTSFNTPELRIDTTEEKKVALVEMLKKKYPKNTDQYTVNFTDGIRISYKDGWALARSSNTQPIIVLRFEATTQAGLDRIQNEIESIVKPYL